MLTKVIWVAAAVAIASGSTMVLTSQAFAKEQTTTVTAIDDPDMITRRIAFADLNLASMQGEKMLNRRVGSAAISLCRDMLPAADYLWSSGCQDKVRSGARPQIESAVMRARQIAQVGHSSIAATAITLSISR
jgi:UrcA family protein